jgi:hypothetical protein
MPSGPLRLTYSSPSLIIIIAPNPHRLTYSSPSLIIIIAPNSHRLTYSSPSPILIVIASIALSSHLFLIISPLLSSFHHQHLNCPELTISTLTVLNFTISTLTVLNSPSAP